MASKGARVHIYGDWDGTGVKKAQQDIGAFEKQATGLAGSFTKSFLGAGAALGGAFAIGNIASSALDFLKDAAATAIEDEKSMVALKVAMDNLGLGFQNAGVEAFTKQLSLASGTADDVLRPAMSRLLRSTGDVAESQKALEMALSISAATGKDVGTVANGLGKAYDGNAASLGRLGLGLDQATLKGGDMNKIMSELTAKFGGQWQAAAATYGGQLERLSVAADEAKETIGYALLGAIDNVSKAMGGTDGMVGGMNSVADSLANVITAIGGATAAIVEYAQQTTIAQAAGEENSGTIVKIGAGLLAWAPALPIVGGLAASYIGLSQAGERMADEQQRVNDELAGTAALYAGYKANSDRAHSATVAMAAAAQDEAEALQDVADAAREYLGVISASQTIDDFRKSLADLNTTLEKNPRTFKGMGDAAKENRDTLRGALGEASKIAQQWVEDGKISADQYNAAYKGLAKKVVNQFVKDGFKRSDIVEFLGAEGIWTGPAKEKLIAAQKAALAAGYSGFKGVGGDVARGFADGITAATWKAEAQARAMAKMAILAAKDALDSNSPSKVFMEIGKDTVAGYIEGMKSKDAEVREQARKSMTESIKATIADTRTTLKEAVAGIKEDMASLADSITSGLMGNINLGSAQDMTTVNDAGETVAMSFIDGLKAQATQVTTFVAKIRELISQGMDPNGPLMQGLLAENAVTGTAIAQELLDGGSTRINQAQDLILAAQTAATSLGVQTAQSFYGTGLETARNLLKGFNEDMRPGGDGYERLMNRMDKLAASMNRTAKITVVVDEVAGAKVNVSGVRAKGGPVWPDGAFIVGEKGPELFMPDTAGTIIPNGGLPSGSGFGGKGASGAPVYNINVSAGVGDPRQIGQQVVEYIKKFEQTNGATWRAA